MSDEPAIDLCGCDRFRLWYAEDTDRVCRCGHRDGDHLDGRGTCTGVIEILASPGQALARSVTEEPKIPGETPGKVHGP